MKKFLPILALLGLLIPTQALADITKDRMEEVYLIAKRECPKVFKSSDTKTYMSAVIAAHGLDHEESMLMFNFCIIYGVGAEDVLARLK